MSFHFDEQVAHDYLEALVLMELAAEFALIEVRPVNKALRNCWRMIRPRFHGITRQIFDGVCRQTYPAGAMRMLRRQLEEVI